MNKKIVVAIVIVIVVLMLGVGGFLLASKTNRSSSVEPTQSANVATTESPKSLKELLTASSAQQCSFSGETGATQTVYISRGKMRGDFTTASAQGTMNSHMVVDGQTSYLWVDGQNTGFKMSFDAASQQQTQQGANNSVDVNKEVDYKCKAWAEDASLFTLPTDIKFTDFSSMVPSASQIPSSGAPSMTKEQQCSACDAAPESARAACKAALGCS